MTTRSRLQARARGAGTVILAVLLGSGGAGPLAGQQRTPVVAAGPAGWLGIQYAFVVSEREARGLPVVVVERVQQGSPAERAGIVAGDTVVRIDGQAASSASFSRLAGRLAPGDRVRLTLRRDGRERPVVVTAAPRPALLPDVALRVDSIRDAIAVRMDSLQVRIRSGEFHFREGAVDSVRVAMDRLRVAPTVMVIGDSVRVFMAPTPPAAVAWSRQWAPEPGEGVSFETFFFHAPETAELRAELQRLSADLRRTLAAHEARLRELGGARSELRESDRELRRLRERAQRLQREMAGVHREMERASREALRREAERGAAEAVAHAEAHVRMFRPLEAYVIGRNFVAGAQLMNLSPELSGYFGVSEGVLLIDVAEGSPAAMAGLVPGDVIVRVGDAGVADLEDLRAAVAGRAGGEVRFTVVRRGERVGVTLPR